MEKLTILEKWRGERSCEEVAKGVPVSHVTWWRWERGDSKVRVDLLPRMVEYTGIPRQQLRPDLYEGMEATR